MFTDRRRTGKLNLIARTSSMMDVLVHWVVKQTNASVENQTNCYS